MSATLDSVRIAELIRGGESLTVEFKGEERNALPDSDIVEVVVCMANASGGVLIVGVEDDGCVTGARQRHRDGTRPDRLAALIANRTMPSVTVRVSLHRVDAVDVIAVEIPEFNGVCSTRDGRCLRRRIGVHGPECVPFYPYEHASRHSDLRLVDQTAQLVPWASWDDLDPVEIERLRRTIARRNGDAALLSLGDREVLQALQLVESRDERLVPNIAAMLLIGREGALQRAVPAHAVAFQVLGGQGEVVMNDWFRGPLLETLEAIEQRFAARNQEQEMTIGLVRLPIPDYAPDSLREALNNAVLHRDYARLDTVFAQFHPDHLYLSNPGGFLEGITLDNLLVHEPKPRNPRLADAFRRIGLVETTGRGIDRIYLGQARYGRPLPDYGQSDRDTVRLLVRGGDASLPFAAFVYEQDRAGKRLTTDELLVMNHLQHERRTDAASVAKLIQRADTHARAVLEALVERGLIEARGERNGRVYHLSAWLYRQFGAPAEYVRARGFDAIRQESMVLDYVAAHGRITRRDVISLCGLTDRQASYLLDKLVRKQKLRRVGELRWAYYELPEPSL